MGDIKQKRQVLGITQKQLAETMGVERSTVAKWETGASMPSSAKLRKLATVLGCGVDDLLSNAETTA